MFRKFRNFFQNLSKTNDSSSSSESSQSSSSQDSSGSNTTHNHSNVDFKSPLEGMPNSEFMIKYRRHKSAPRLSPIGLGLVDNPDSKFDTMAYIIHCPRHNTIAVYHDQNENIKWLPFTPLFPEKSWTESAIIGTLLILCNDSEDKYNSLKQQPPFTSVQLLEILRIQLPQTLSFLTRMIFYIKLKTDSANLECCASISAIAWTPLKDLANGLIPNIWGPELVQYSRVVYSNFENFNERIEEFSLDDVYLYSPRDPPRNVEETMLLELNISEKTIEILYNDFLDHCYPCFSLPIESFKHYMAKYGFQHNDDRLNSLFLAFNYNKNGYVSFHELLMGLVALEPNASHHETRIKFIFRFYDFGGKSYLDIKDFEKMVIDINPNIEGDEFQEKLDESIKLVGITEDSDKIRITFANFKEAIGEHRFRGTSKLCRSAVPVFMQLSRAFIHKKRANSDDLKEWTDLNAVLMQRTHKGTCKKCKSNRYKLATHSVKVDSTGYVGHPVRIVNGETSAAPKDPRSVEYVFNENSVSNVFLKLIREFNEHKGRVVAPRGLFDAAKDRQRMYDLLVKLANEAKPVLKGESRCPNVSPPCFVIGDIHGNIEDLLTLEKILWRSVPCVGPNYLFLGDYVDRGKWGLECAVYLISLKLLDPGKITLLRGNHEVRALQEKYTYKKECIRKYGNELGEKIWQLTNQLFDSFPIAATIDNAIFCTHGGLSPNAQTLDQIRKLPNPLSDPEHQSKIAWELLWSDPCHIQQFLDIIELTDASNDYAHEGYVFNQKRGAAYLFNERAASTFLARNGLSHMIRAHEVPPFGFAHHFNNVCTTVFSCSHYCNYDNEAACILVDNGRIRVIRIDTHNNAPATDK